MPGRGGVTYGLPPSPTPYLPLCGVSYNTCPHQMPAIGVYIWHPSFSSSPLPLCGASYNTCPLQMPGSRVYIWHPSFSSSPLPLCGVHIIPVLIRCQAVGFTYGNPSPPPPLFSSLPLCGASYNICPHQMPGSGVYIWHPSFSSSPLPLCVVHIIPVLIRCQAVGFTYGIPYSPPPPPPPPPL